MTGEKERVGESASGSRAGDGNEPEEEPTAGRGDPEPWRLPGLSRPAAEGWYRGRTAAGRPFRTPRLSTEGADAVAARVRSAALRARGERTVEQVLRRVSRAARRLSDPATESGAEARDLLAAELGWPPALAAETLGRMGTVWRERALRGVLASELGDLRLLDGFRGDDRRKRRAAGPPLLMVVNAGNVPGVAVTAVLRALLVRSGVLCKAPREEPGLLALLARSLEAEDALLGASLATTWWPGENEEPTGAAWVKHAGKVIVYGGDDAVMSVRSRTPADTDVFVYGPKLGVGVVLPDAADGAGEAAAGLARDVCAYEQQGCVSPRLVYVVGAAPDRFAARLGQEMEREVGRLPRPPARPEEAVAIRSLRAEAEFRGYGEAEGGEGSRVLGSREDLSWTVLVGGDPAPVSEGLRRVVRAVSVPDLDRLETALAPLEGRIQAIGYAGRKGLGEMAEVAIRLGVARVAPFGTVAWPPADWRHDGRHQILPLLCWTDWE